MYCARRLRPRPSLRKAGVRVHALPQDLNTAVVQSLPPSIHTLGVSRTREWTVSVTSRRIGSVSVTSRRIGSESSLRHPYHGMPLEPYEARVRFPRVAPRAVWRSRRGARPRVGPTLNRELGGPIAKAGWVGGFCVALLVARPTLFIVT